ncbi:HlyD family secretion protein [Siccirubricoccus sp. KC 17139]|uniref:HlyD family secretion protein n=1 Tax=Siccirubricoccus soli TaxID=2899147 RepID=A0ABT1D6A2_9PROT|nr:HlyD family secretion protein [Siccirubricoccus soli]MCO6416535.1 HlyD family secretion protein [Siccirubricoccus soli]MCP2682670.1 HlyD family secretion protein [Siccirubricoccus soli]
MALAQASNSGPPDPPRDSLAPESGAGTGKPAKRPASPRRKWLIRGGLIVAGLLILVGGTYWGLHWWTEGRFVESTNDAYLQADQVAVSSRVPGIVHQVLVGDNEVVRAGQPLVELDGRDIRARLAQAVAQANVGRANLAEAEAQISAQQAQIAQAQAQVDGARSQVAFAEREATRYARLAATGAEPRERADQMRQNRDQARAQLAQASAALLAAQRQIETLRAQAQQSRAQIEQAEALQQQSQVDLDSTVVRASIDGRVGDRTVRPGQYMQPGARMMTVVPVHALYLVANFKETQIGRMRPGQPVSIKVDALDSRTIRGTLDSISPGTGAQFALIPPNNATGNFTKIVQRVPVRIHVEAEPDDRAVLVPGLSVTAEVDTRNVEEGRSARASRSSAPATIRRADAAPSAGDHQ